jgi:hypothetical protein
MKYNLTSGDKKIIRELAGSYMHGEESSDVTRLKKYLSRKNNKIEMYRQAMKI